MERFQTLLEGFISGSLEPEELREFVAAIGENTTVVEAQILQDLQEGAYVDLTTAEQRERMLANINLRKETKLVPVRRMKLWKWVAAASVIIILAIGSHFYLSNKNETHPTAATPNKVNSDVAPGRQGAILTLSNGKQIILDSTTGNIANEGGIAVNNNDGSVIYNQTETPNSQPETVFNTMSTPKGRQYTLTLSDGTKVWLNAASSITYPVAFTGSERKVQVTGEIYFEVAHNASKPFIVSKGETSVEVLGTHFNVNAYDDEESIKVTLLEGSVKVSRLTSHDSRVIKPGEQAVVTQNAKLQTLNPDLDAVMAWKNGLFSFNNSSLQEVMNQLARWYDVTVVYEGKIPERKFGGEISMNSNLSKVLEILKVSKVKFTIDGNKLIVRP